MHPQFWLWGTWRWHRRAAVCEGDRLFWTSRAPGQADASPLRALGRRGRNRQVLEVTGALDTHGPAHGRLTALGDHVKL